MAALRILRTVVLWFLIDLGLTPQGWLTPFPPSTALRAVPGGAVATDTLRWPGDGRAEGTDS